MMIENSGGLDVRAIDCPDLSCEQVVSPHSVLGVRFVSEFAISFSELKGRVWALCK